MEQHERDELKLQELLARLRLKEPPHELMENFIGEVRAKIASQRRAWGVGFSLALGVTLLAVLGVMLAPIVVRKEPPVSQPAQAVLEAKQPQAASDEELFLALEEELFVLEMLGEDEGLIDVPGRLEMDLEFFEQVGTSVS